MIHIIKQTTKNIVVSFILASIISLIVYIIFSEPISIAVSLINKISLDNNQKVIEEIKLSDNKILVYPEYGTKYANISIESIGVDLPLYYGETLDLLKDGIGQSSGAYFPR